MRKNISVIPKGFDELLLSDVRESDGTKIDEDDDFLLSPQLKGDYKLDIEFLESEASRPKEIGKLSPEVPKRWLQEYKK